MSIMLTPAQAVALDHVRRAYMGPENGATEEVLNRPHLQYSVGMLFPAESPTQEPETSADVIPGEVEDRIAGPPLAEEWRPSSVAISFVTDGDEVLCDVTAATYRAVGEDVPRWVRVPFSEDGILLTREMPATVRTVGEIKVEIGSRWRSVGDGNLVTIHLRSLAAPVAEARWEAASVLFQVMLGARPVRGARIAEYRSRADLALDRETAELRLRYRDRTIFAVGHGMAADWELDGDRECVRVFLDAVPSAVVPSIRTTAFNADAPEARALDLSLLSRADEVPDEVADELDRFVDEFERWVSGEVDRAGTFTGEDLHIATRIAERGTGTLRRMREGVALLRKGGPPRSAFALGMAAMSLQMRRAAISQGRAEDTPTWRPFQLGFLLVSLASTTDHRHHDRALVDLIWFPTGGGKTEAYLALAAVEIFRRRLVDGHRGGGTAVITRYTLRLLTSQQFERAAALVCAMELLRRDDPRVRGMSPFTIGLWVGNDVTPSSSARAKAALGRLLKARRPEEANEFQIQSCPWCKAPLVPRTLSTDPRRYGFVRLGNQVVVRCTDQTCEFSDELPLLVVDDDIYAEPPTILLATVDKFARLQFKPEAGRLLGIATPHAQPSLIIQDELHLLAGPLGTTVAVFDTALQLLLELKGPSPKIVASTATIRASGEQVSALYGRDSALYPPAGIDGDRTFFSAPVDDGTGRLYVGLMPQSISQASALVSAAAPLFELPSVAGEAIERDAYWTAVLYHNSLRELGRTGTLVLDDVNSRLRTRAQRAGRELREVGAGSVLELTSRRGAEELPGDLRALERPLGDANGAVDAVLSSNMLSVGIDVSRLALMLMVGQPKTTSEYIQATSRVGRGDVNGIVVTLFRSNRARDRSHFETFRGFHDALYRSVEPTSVTPWALASRERSIAGALVALVRQAVPALASDESARDMNLSDETLRSALDPLVAAFVARVASADAQEADGVRADFERLLREWERRSESARHDALPLRYERRDNDPGLLKRFGQDGEGWLVGDSMRSVEPNVAIAVQEPREEATREAYRP